MREYKTERERFTLSLSGGKETVKSLCERWIMGRSFSRFPRRGDVCSWMARDRVECCWKIENRGRGESCFSLG